MALSYYGIDSIQREPNESDGPHQERMSTKGASTKGLYSQLALRRVDSRWSGLLGQKNCCIEPECRYGKSKWIYGWRERTQSDGRYFGGSGLIQRTDTVLWTYASFATGKSQRAPKKQHDGGDGKTNETSISVDESRAKLEHRGQVVYKSFVRGVPNNSCHISPDSRTVHLHMKGDGMNLHDDGTATIWPVFLSKHSQEPYEYC
ncbi:hypothetical protein CLF_105933, partial [Clonorchis sinensis]